MQLGKHVKIAINTSITERMDEFFLPSLAGECVVIVFI